MARPKAIDCTNAKHQGGMRVGRDGRRYCHHCQSEKTRRVPSRDYSIPNHLADVALALLCDKREIAMPWEREVFEAKASAMMRDGRITKNNYPKNRKRAKAKA